MAVYGNAASSYWKTAMDYSSNTSGNTSVSVSATLYLYYSKKHTNKMGYNRPSYLSCNGATQYFYPTGDVKKSAGTHYRIGSRSFSLPKKETAYYATLTASIKHYKGDVTGTSTVSRSIYVPALTSHEVKFDGNKPPLATGTVENLPSSFVKYYGKDLVITDQVPTLEGFKFLNWNTSADGTGTTYIGGSTYSVNDTVEKTLYAIWIAENAPSCDVGELTFTDKIKNFSTLSCEITNISSAQTITSIKLYVGTDESNTLTEEGTLSVVPTASGSNSVRVVIVDALGVSTTYTLPNVDITNPTWQSTSTFSTMPPDIRENGIGMFDKIWEYNFTTSEWDEIDEDLVVTVGANSWSVERVFDEAHTENSSIATEGTVYTNKLKVDYNHSESEEKDYRKAFFETTRNQNYSNGISNTMFVSGSSSPNYTSRVWWSAVNNPLYFPDLNYVEVGSNDTSIQGLCKVGDYLGAVKQSKTTDTAIYLLYPTSFDDETTYAVKQGVQGVGALSKYSFNILGDETLFLSPNGVVAIAPSEDDEHKVLNRSYFIDKKLLAEDGIKGSYSFVYEGMYWLSMGNEQGHCYVLDGNQRNSWGNDKTNLVYEAYYLENVPASCFMKFQDYLVFSNSKDVCRFKKEGETNLYSDSYDNYSGEQNVPVKAEWSTILDDDGSLHYYKTMQKKGNVVSVLPRASEHTEVLIKKDNEEPVLINRTFSEASDIPSELYVNKKFKKYKRLQFIIRNEEAESFGVDSITKSYSLGNYAKR